MVEPNMEDLRNQLSKLRMADKRAIDTQLNVSSTKKMRREGVKHGGYKAFGNPNVLRQVVNPADAYNQYEGGRIPEKKKSSDLNSFLRDFSPLVESGASMDRMMGLAHYYKLHNVKRKLLEYMKELDDNEASPVVKQMTENTYIDLNEVIDEYERRSRGGKAMTMIDEKLYEKLPPIKSPKNVIKRKVVGVEKVEKVDTTGSGLSYGSESYRKKAKQLGKSYSKNMMDMDPELKQLVGSGFLHDFLTGFTSVLDLGSEIERKIPGPEAKLASVMTGVVNTGAKLLDDLTYKKKTKKTKPMKIEEIQIFKDNKHPEIEEKIKRGRGKPKKPTKPGDKRKIRGQQISKLMKGGMKLGEASKYLKNNSM